MIVVRVIWVPIFTYVPRWLFRRVRERDPYPPWQYPVVISWAGVRGAVSLAAALALPNDVPHRDLIVFVTFVVILVSLIGPVLTLPGLVRVLGIRGGRLGGSRGREGAHQSGGGGSGATRGACGRGLGASGDTAERLRSQYRFRASRFQARYTARTTTASRNGRRVSSGCGASCSTPSAARCSRCATTGSSPKR